MGTAVRICLLSGGIPSRKGDAGASGLRVRFADDRRCQAELPGDDPDTDVAVLRGDAARFIVVLPAERTSEKAARRP